MCIAYNLIVLTVFCADIFRIY